jgi:hypothetical protein
MTIVAPPPVTAPFDQNQLRPGSAFFADYRTGTIEPFTGQAPTFTRSGTQSIVTSLDPYTIGANQPRLEWVQGALAYVPTGSTLQYPFPNRAIFPTRMYVKLVRTSTTSGVIARIGSVSSAAASMTLEQNGARYLIRYQFGDGTENSISTLPFFGVPADTPIDLIATCDLSDENNVLVSIAWRSTGNYNFIGSIGDVPRIDTWSDDKLHVGSLAGSSVPGSAIAALLIDYSPGLNRPWGWR